MAISITLEPAHAAVCFALFSSVLVDTWLGNVVSAARKKYDVPLPYLYADASHGEKGRQFNCVQRGHQNTVEKYPTYIILQVLSAFEYPLVSAGLGLLYQAGRVFYMRGYSQGDPKKRSYGFFGYLGSLGMIVLSVKSIYTIATSA
ncbi:membrane-associated proteins in eicosanoid and glutathione metabolism [Gonapodya prolifera JEL478]|uniref:Membrane-associated proteins in eicosanoid and glutathione metabolism n=1 Tax=Gonapodya prolifera (strain JEL478) TaxID=1344416 RepID=A0A139AX09_GONPJ|nr:membrane-associated proteins in eicosanoid and glutathione metabolism [Gonapodya prolifera JEL478]|eukprot:KXS21260.1 membrane-associated proteins in eicosanoid and glutathione metabolism [Gonapodya prolifera JEL478]